MSECPEMHVSITRGWQGKGKLEDEGRNHKRMKIRTEHANLFSNTRAQDKTPHFHSFRYAWSFS